MEENIADTLVALATILHWLGKYRESNAVVLLSRLCRVSELRGLEDLEEHVLALEMTDDRPASEAKGTGDTAKAMLGVVRAAEVYLDYRGPEHGDWSLWKTLHNAIAAVRRTSPLPCVERGK